jgi:LDH2 family malate/lactate/ureidoglycolate dehydrogenase
MAPFLQALRESRINVESESIRRQIAAILSARGMDAEPVSITAAVMLEADLAAIDSMTCRCR